MGVERFTPKIYLAMMNRAKISGSMSNSFSVYSERRKFTLWTRPMGGGGRSTPRKFSLHIGLFSLRNFLALNETA